MTKTGKDKKMTTKTDELQVTFAELTAEYKEAEARTITQAREMAQVVDFSQDSLDKLHRLEDDRESLHNRMDVVLHDLKRRGVL